jgi:hypothetical protein
MNVILTIEETHEGRRVRNVPFFFSLSALENNVKSRQIRLNIFILSCHRGNNIDDARTTKFFSPKLVLSLPLEGLLIFKDILLFGALRKRDN